MSASFQDSAKIRPSMILRTSVLQDKIVMPDAPLATEYVFACPNKKTHAMNRKYPLICIVEINSATGTSVLDSIMLIARPFVSVLRCLLLSVAFVMTR